jgi:hypothetical protein
VVLMERYREAINKEPGFEGLPSMPPFD